MNVVAKNVPPQLPENIDDWQRSIKVDRTLNDLVEELHKRLWGKDEEYRRLLFAVYDEQAVEGSLAADNTLAAQKLRQVAEQINSPATKEKLGSIVKALNIVLRRYNQSRKERRNKVGGEIIPPESNGE